jgi:hypothetical protein
MLFDHFIWAKLEPYRPRGMNIPVRGRDHCLIVQRGENLQVCRGRFERYATF